MNVFISGGTGFVGNHLIRKLLDTGCSILASGSRPVWNRIRHPRFSYLSADTTKPGDWQNRLEEMDAVVNLAGRTIFHRWNDSYKRLIYDSRILTTRHIVDALPSNRPLTLVSTSAAGYYGHRGDDILTEEEPSGNDFLAGVCRDWEAEAFRAKVHGIRVCVARFGVVLGKNGGAMEKMLPAFRFGVGGPLGTGMQWFPWIHIDDLINGIRWLIEHPNAKGVFNFCAPNPIRNKDFAKTLGQILNRPALMPAPAFMIRWILGEMGTSLLASQRAVPGRLSQMGFTFTHPSLESAIRQIVSLYPEQS